MYGNVVEWVCMFVTYNEKDDRRICLLIYVETNFGNIFIGIVNR